MDRLKKKFVSAKQYLPAPVIENVAGAKEAIIAFGSTLPAVQEARVLLENSGRKMNLLRLRALPFADEVKEFVRCQDKVYIVEMNRDGQLYENLLIAMPELASKLVSVAYSDGMPPTAKRIMNEIIGKEHK
jgi:2-oxoglutarate ferredoxin oxidoreductase subunit alpha